MRYNTSALFVIAHVAKWRSISGHSYFYNLTADFCIPHHIVTYLQNTYFEKNGFEYFGKLMIERNVFVNKNVTVLKM